MISSAKNPEIVEAAKLRKKRRRDESGRYLIDGTKLLFEALGSGVEIERAYATEGWLLANGERLEGLGVEPTAVSDAVLRRLSSLSTPEGVVAVALAQAPPELSGPLVFLDGIQDPGNLGTIIRTADAAGFGGVVCSEGCADLYNEKTLRATMGSLFHIGVARRPDFLEAIREAKAGGAVIIGADLEGEELRLNAVDVPRSFAIVLGNEANGISEGVLAECDRLVRIPVRGGAESLNVSVAAGIIMYAYTDQ